MQVRRTTGPRLAEERRPVAMVFFTGPGSFAAWMAVAAGIAVVAGMVLGILAAWQVSLGADRWSQAVQAHGRLQLFGFAAAFIVALVFEFVPRLQMAVPFSPFVRTAVPGVLALGSLVLAVGQVWHDYVGWLVHPGSALFATGALAVVPLIWRTPAPRPLSSDPQPLFVRFASLWLAAAAIISAIGFTRADSGIVPLDYSRAAIEIFLRGFVLLTIVGVALRAFPGHIGTAPMAARRQLVLLAAINVANAAWLSAQGLGSLPHIEWLSRGSDALLAVAILAATAWLGMPGASRHAFGGPRYQLLVPLAWLGAVVYAILLLAAALLPWGTNMDLYEQGAVRHVFMLGFMVPLMVAMAHVVLARFGTGRVPGENFLSAAFVLVVVAWPLRVVPALFFDASAGPAQALLVIAGFLVMGSLGLTAAVCLRTALGVLAATRRRQAELPSHIPLVVRRSR